MRTKTSAVAVSLLTALPHSGVAAGTGTASARALTPIESTGRSGTQTVTVNDVQALRAGLRLVGRAYAR